MAPFLSVISMGVEGGGEEKGNSWEMLSGKAPGVGAIAAEDELAAKAEVAGLLS